MANYLGPQEASQNLSIRDIPTPYAREWARGRGELPEATRTSPIAEEMRALNAAVCRYRDLLERLTPLIPQVPHTGSGNANGGPQPVRSVLVQEVYDLRLKVEECNAILDRVEV